MAEEDRSRIVEKVSISSHLLLFAAKIIILGVLFLCTLLLWFAVDIPLIFFAGVILSVFIHSLSSPLSRITHLPHPASILVVVLVLAGICWLAGSYLAPNVGRQFDMMTNQLPRAISNVQDQISKTTLGNELLSRAPSLGDVLTSQKIISPVKKVFTVTFGLLSDFFIFFFAGLYLTVAPDVYIRGIIRLVPSNYEERAAGILNDMAATLKRWLLGRLASMSAVGIITGLGLWLLGVPLALTLGLVAFFLTFIPYLGAVISAVPAILFALLIEPIVAAWVACLYLGAHAVEAYVVSPLVQQHQVQMPPVLTLIVQVVLWYAAGLLGVMMATPLTAVILVLIKTLYLEDVLGKKVRLPGEKRESA